jgi:hypothetical protein
MNRSARQLARQFSRRFGVALKEQTARWALRGWLRRRKARAMEIAAAEVTSAAEAIGVPGVKEASPA